VLPVLPLVLASGGADGRRSRYRPLAIVAGLATSFAFFTLAAAAILSALGLPQDFLRNVAIALLFVLAATLLFPRVGLVVERPLYRLTRRRVGADAGGFVLGASLGLVFVPCGGPVIATITSVAAAGNVGLRAIVLTAAYAVGIAVPMLAIAYGGRRLSAGMKVLRTHAEATRRVAGAIIAGVALAIVLNLDQKVTTIIPDYTKSARDAIEQSAAARDALGKVRRSGQARAAPTAGQANRAPAFTGISQWINTPGGRPLSLSKLRGKVVLVDFWTYSCINCIRTFPHLKAWDRAYRKDGLVIVGVHSPEFAFERVPSNVRGAARRFGLRYPIAIDNGYGTWNAYQNEYWPAEYLIDRTGVVRHTHFGEGEYGETESFIRRLLGGPVSLRRTRVADRTPTEITTPELYLGYSRLDPGSFSGRVNPDRWATYRFPSASLPGNHLAYAGRWRVGLQKILAGDRARLRLQFSARAVYVVLAGRGRVEALVNRRHVRTLQVTGLPRLYTVLSSPELTGGLLELRFSRGVAGYSFTFG
jgi:cytochrome c biogenesis protein CcdA/thiol-disulfide isomerase/thioredoxin